MMSTQYVFINGEFVPDEDAKISVRTHAFLYGTSIFEGIRGYWREDEKQIYVFRMKEHYERMHKNSKILHMTPPYSVQEMCDITLELIRKNNMTGDVYIRPTLYKSNYGIGPKLDGPDSFMVFTCPMGEYVDISKGLSICVSSWYRLEDNALPPRGKFAGAYVNTALIKTDAVKAGFDEALTLNSNGFITEGSAMNFYLVENCKLVTSREIDNILVGITRQTIKELAKKELGLEVEERPINRTELYMADEAFLCGTGAQVSPITSIDHRPLGDGKVGPISKKIQDLYFEVVRGRVDKYKHWCRAVYDN
ncbi:MAG: branched-chain amino acid transaminase [Candidatus Gastranaerophilales bacterium]|nr:branched-chain amino acid transaminase [Candidatus Gastranaerophilales bacterium]